MARRSGAHLWLPVATLIVVVAGFVVATAGPATALGTDRRIRVPRWTLAPTPPRSRYLFTFEDPAALAGFRRDEGLDDVVKGATDALGRARALAAWARAQFAPTRPDPYPPLSAPVFLSEIRAGRTGGFCAQYAALVVQGLAALGELSMYVTVHEHEIISVYDHHAKSWMYYDPSDDVWATDTAGHVLSPLDVHRRLSGQVSGSVHWQSGSAHDDAWYASYAERPRDMVAYWLENGWTTRPRNFEEIQRGLLFWCPLKEGCEVPDGAVASHDAVDFESIAVDAAGYHASANR